LNLSCVIHTVSLDERFLLLSRERKEEGPTYKNDLLISMLQLLNSISAGAPNSAIPNIPHDQLGAQTLFRDKD
jgi:hypothetical protein